MLAKGIVQEKKNVFGIDGNKDRQREAWWWWWYLMTTPGHGHCRKPFLVNMKPLSPLLRPSISIFLCSSWLLCALDVVYRVYTSLEKISKSYDTTRKIMNNPFAVCGVWCMHFLIRFSFPALKRHFMGFVIQNANIHALKPSNILFHIFQK